MSKRPAAFEKLKDISLQVPWFGRVFDISRILGLFQFFRTTLGTSNTRNAAGKTGVARFMPDIVSVCLIMILAVLFAGRANIDLNVRPSPVHKPTYPIQPSEITKAESGIVMKAIQTQDIRGRNIFTTTGLYTESANQALPENPYTLIGVLLGKEKRAVFKEYTGAVITLPVGKQLIDGFQIVGIDNTSVILKRRSEKKELRMFDVHKRQREVKKKP